MLGEPINEFVFQENPDQHERNSYFELQLEVH